MATHRLASKIKVAPVSAGSTKGKMKLFRKIVKAECTDFMDVIGVGRFSQSGSTATKIRFSL